MTQKPMTKAQLVSALADATGSDKASSNRMLDALSGIITKEVAGGGAVTVPNVGKFFVELDLREWSGILYRGANEKTSR